MQFLKLTFVLFWFLLSGCSVLNISRSEPNGEKAKAIAGVPFYLRAGACKSETVWLQPVFLVRLVKVTTRDAQETLEEIGFAALSREGFGDVGGPPGQLREALEKGSDEVTIRKWWGEVMKKAVTRPPDKNLAAGDVSLVSNTNSFEAYVDYSTKYYYNVRRPLVGSAKAEFKLNADGTLGEGTGEVESKTAETLLSLFAAKEIIEQAAGVGVRAQAAAAPRYRLIIETKIFRISWYAYSPIPTSGSVPCPAPTREPIFSESCPGGYNCKREEVKP